MAYGKFGSVQDNFSRFLYEYQSKNQNICQETWKDPNKII